MISSPSRICQRTVSSPLKPLAKSARKLNRLRAALPQKPPATGEIKGRSIYSLPPIRYALPVLIPLALAFVARHTFLLSGMAYLAVGVPAFLFTSFLALRRTSFEKLFRIEPGYDASKRGWFKKTAKVTGGVAVLGAAGLFDTVEALTPSGIKSLSDQQLVFKDLHPDLNFDWTKDRTTIPKPTVIDNIDDLRTTQKRDFITTRVGDIAYLYLRPANWNGESIVLHHGGPDHLQSSIDTIIGLYKQGYQVLAYDRPGPGYSKPNEMYDYSLACQAKLAHEMPRLLGIDSYYVAGHSYGLRAAGEALYRYGAFGIKGIIGLASEMPTVSNLVQLNKPIISSIPITLDGVMTSSVGASFDKLGFIAATPGILEEMYGKFSAAEIAKRVQAYLAPVKKGAEIFDFMTSDAKTREIFQSWRTDTALSHLRHAYTKSRRPVVSKAISGLPYLHVVGKKDKCMVDAEKENPSRFGTITYQTMDVLTANSNNRYVEVDAGHYVTQEAAGDVVKAIHAFVTRTSTPPTV